MKVRSSVFLLLPLLLSTSCDRQDEVFEQKTFLAFDTFIEVSIVPRADKEVWKDIETVLTDYHRLCDAYPPVVEYATDLGPNVCEINSKNDVFTVDERLFGLLKYAMEKEEIFGGRFDLLLGGLSALWKPVLQAEEKPKLPSQDAIDQALADRKESRLMLMEGNKVQRVGKATIDLGAIAKGYALKDVRTILSKAGLEHYFINAGHSSILKAGKENDPLFSPIILGTSSNEEIRFTTPCEAIGTSSINEQKVTIDGVTYSHIIDPKTGKAQSRHETVVVADDDPAFVDMASTAFMLMEKDEIEKIAKDNELAVMIIDNNGDLDYVNKEGFTIV